MPVNRNALIRYKTIDKCLQNKYRKWTLENLIEACSEALYEYEGIQKGISKRTIQMDLQIMRSDKLGYNAPIIVYENKYYTYEEEDYSITNIPLSDTDLAKLSEAVDFMKQFKGFSHFRHLDSMVQKLEDHIYSQKSNQEAIIDFEKNENLKGLEYLEPIYQSIKNKTTLLIHYKSFVARSVNSFDFFPYLLKEFKNRWFIIGTKGENRPILTLALDRIERLGSSKTAFYQSKNFNPKEIYKNVIGVTVSPDIEPERIELFVTRKHAQYVITKPIHWSQKLLESDEYGIRIELKVQLNFELEKEILGFGDGMIVLEPQRLKKRIEDRINIASEQYQSILNKRGIKNIQLKLEKAGCAHINFLYTKNTIRMISSKLLNSGWFEKNTSQINDAHPFYSELEKLVLNKSLTQILSSNKLRKVEFFSKIPDELFQWKQHLSHSGYYVYFFLEEKKQRNFSVYYLPGTFKTTLDPSKVDFIISHSEPLELSLLYGRALVVNSKLLHKFSDKLIGQNVKLMRLVFN